MYDYIKCKLSKIILDPNFTEILNGSAWSLAARMFAIVLSLLVNIIIAKTYGAGVVGIVAVVQSFLMFVTIFTVLGTNTSVLRLIPEHLSKYSATSAYEIYKKIQRIVVLVSIITGATFYFNSSFFANNLFSKPHLSYYFSLSSVFIIFSSLMQLNTQAVRGLRLIKVFALMQVLPQGFNLLILLLFGSLWPCQELPVYALLGGMVLTSMFGWVIITHSFSSNMKPTDRVKCLAGRKILKISLPMLMTSTMTFAIGQTGVIMLGMFRTEAEVGHYAIAVKLATLTAFILNAVNTMAAPKFSELFHSDKIEKLFQVAKNSAKLIFWATTPILLGSIFLGKLVLRFAFGQEFTVAYPVLLILVIGQFVNSICGTTGVFMNMTGNQSAYKNIVSIAAIINIVFNCFLIPKYGIYGAASAATTSVLVWNIGTLLYIKRKFGKTVGYFPTLALF